jgi:hypothetical protein
MYLVCMHACTTLYATGASQPLLSRSTRHCLASTLLCTTSCGCLSVIPPLSLLVHGGLPGVPVYCLV